jgi:putative tryptophan/tyrosine transport system substrate-binding protein
MRRRDFIAAFAGGAASWLLAARATQVPTLPKVGVLMPLLESDPTAQSLVAAFRGALAKLGWTEGSNLQIDVRWGDPNSALLARYAAEPVALGPQVLVCTGTVALKALSQQTSTIPIVFASVLDPVGQGFVQSLARPGGNITGFSIDTGFSFTGKWVEMLRQIAPPVAHIVVLFNPETTPFADPQILAIKEAAQSFGQDVRIAPVHDVSELEEAMRVGLAPEEHGALMVLPSPFAVAHRVAIIAFAAKRRLPSLYSFPVFAADGGLISYGQDLTDPQRHTAEYVDRIVKGEAPGDLPVQTPVSFKLVINLKTARALGITIAPSLLALADEVIE